MCSKNINEVNEKQKTPDEKGNLSVDSHIKIFDPTTKEEFVNKRG